MKNEASSGSRSTVNKAMRILHSFTRERPELSVGDLSADLGLHKSDVSRLVAVLRDWKMIEKDPYSQKLRIGEGAFRVGGLYSQNDNLAAVSRAYMNGLVTDTGHSVHVSILDGDHILVVATVESPNALRVIMRLGEHRPLHSTAAGKLFLAYSEDLSSRILSRPLEALTVHTVSSPRSLKGALKRVRREGIAWNKGENSIGAGAVAAPIFDSTGQVIGALSTVFPLHVVNASDRNRAADLTASAAQHISAQLGYRNEAENRKDRQCPLT